MPATLLPHAADPYADIFVGDGEMARLMRAHDWGSTPLGTPDTWSQSLKTALRILLTSRFQMWLGWGDDVHFFYNDAYRPTLGEKHPRALGMPTRELWAEIWDDVSGHIDRVYRKGESTWDDALRLMLQRHGYVEETYHTFSYSPLVDDQAVVRGLFCAVSEETNRVITDRRLRAVRELAAGIAAAPSRTALLENIERALEATAHDLPFAALYLYDEAGDAERIGIAGLAPDHGLAPARLAAGSVPPWMATGTVPQTQSTCDLPPGVSAPRGPWRDPVRQVVIAPLSAAAAPRAVGFLVAGLNPHRVPDDDYLGFISLCAGHIGNAIERIIALEASRAERDYLRKLFRQAPGFMCVLRGANFRYEIVNAAYEQLVAHAGIEGLHVLDVVPRKGNEALLAILDETYRTGRPYVGESFHVMLGRPEAPSGGRYLDFIFQPIFDDVGAVSGIFVNGHDVTDKVWAEHGLRVANEELEARIADRTRDLASALARLRAEVAEREAIEATLRQSQKMEAVGQLTGGIAHDFNNLLAAIMGSLELMQRRLPSDKAAQMQRYIDISQAAARRAASLTQRLLAFSRRQTLSPSPTNVNRLVADMEDLIRRSIGPQVSLQVVLTDGLWNTLVDRNQLENALLNLCINANDAMPQGGRIVLQTENCVLDEQAGREAMLPPGQYIAMSVTDTGVGMPPDVLNRVFEPFFTTKPLGTGTGLGLSMVYGFVRQSGGEVTVTSAVGHGTSLRIYLPRDYRSEPQVLDAPVPAAPAQGAALRILLVDDEASVRTLIRETLLEDGHAVVEAATGASGMVLLQDDPAIDLLITDVGLPGGMNGRQLADAARSLSPALKVLFITGYAADAAMDAEYLPTQTRVLTKPFVMDALRRQVRELTDAAQHTPTA